MPTLLKARRIGAKRVPKAEPSERAGAWPYPFKEPPAFVLDETRKRPLTDDERVALISWMRGVIDDAAKTAGLE